MSAFPPAEANVRPEQQCEALDHLMDTLAATIVAVNSAGEAVARAEACWRRTLEITSRPGGGPDEDHASGSQVAPQSLG